MKTILHDVTTGVDYDLWLEGEDTIITLKLGVRGSPTTLDIALTKHQIAELTSQFTWQIYRWSDPLFKYHDKIKAEDEEFQRQMVHHHRLRRRFLRRLGLG